MTVNDTQENQSCGNEILFYSWYPERACKGPIKDQITNTLRPYLADRIKLFSSTARFTFHRVRWWRVGAQRPYRSSCLRAHTLPVYMYPFGVPRE